MQASPNDAVPERYNVELRNQRHGKFSISPHELSLHPELGLVCLAHCVLEVGRLKVFLFCGALAFFLGGPNRASLRTVERTPSPTMGQSLQTKNYAYLTAPCCLGWRSVSKIELVVVSSLGFWKFFLGMHHLQVATFRVSTDRPARRKLELVQASADLLYPPISDCQGPALNASALTAATADPSPGAA